MGDVSRQPAKGPTHKVSPAGAPRTDHAPPLGGRMSDVPQPAPGVITRRRLLEMLGNAKPLTVVSAPAGYGKSVLVESWVAGHVSDVTLVRSALKEEDPLREHVWPSFLEALRNAGITAE